MCSGSEAGSYLRLIVSLSLRLKDLLGPVTRVKTVVGARVSGAAEADAASCEEKENLY